MEIEPFRMETFYSGLLHGWGHLVDRRGGGERRMTATLDGRWDGEVLTLDQDWRTEGAPPERRLWRIRPTTHGYAGTAADIVGTAEARRTAEGGLRWTYQTDVAVGDQSWRLACEEELLPQTPNVATVTIRIGKFGLAIAEIHMILSRATPIPPSGAAG